MRLILPFTLAMQREQRLTHKKQFATVHSQGRSWANELLIMKAFPNGLELSRFGFSISKHVGKAVVRNRIKRLLREYVQLMPWKPGWDVVFIARSSASEADRTQLKEAVERLNRRSRLRELT